MPMLDTVIACTSMLDATSKWCALDGRLHCTLGRRLRCVLGGRLHAAVPVLLGLSCPDWDFLRFGARAGTSRRLLRCDAQAGTSVRRTGDSLRWRCPSWDFGAPSIGDLRSSVRVRPSM